MDTGAEEMDVEDLNEYVRRRLRVYLGCAMTCVDSELSEQASILSATSDLFAEFGFEVYNPSLVTEPGSFHDCREVYAIDHVQAVSSDLIFMIRVQSSLGMGIEAQITADMLIPWGEVKFKGEASKLSPILSGLPTRGIGFQVHLDRASPSDYRDHLRAMLKKHDLRNQIIEASRAREHALSILCQANIGFTIRQQRLLLRMPAAELAEKTGIPEWWLKHIEEHAVIAAGISQVQLCRIVRSLKLRFESQANGFPRLVSEIRWPVELAAKASEFVSYLSTCNDTRTSAPLSDRLALDRWGEVVENSGLLLPLPACPDELPASRSLLGYFSLPVSAVSGSESSDLNAVVPLQI